MPRRSSRAPSEPFDIQFPDRAEQLDQDEECFEFTLDGIRRRLRIHDYADLYSVPGLYEALVYQKLKCRSPRRLTQVLSSVLTDWSDGPEDLRVLDLGAGNGIVAQRLCEQGVDHIVGLDLLPEAKSATERDRPDVYDEYLVADLTDLSTEDRAALQAHKLNCLVTVAALGFGDIPPLAFANAFNLIAEQGWLAMTIKDSFLEDREDDSGFARLLRTMMLRGVLDVQSHLRYRHRLSIEGEKLFYVAVVARKTRHIPASIIEEICGDGEARHAVIDKNEPAWLLSRDGQAVAT